MLLKLFMVSAVTLAAGEEDAFEHVAGVLTNVTRLEAGRQLLLQPGRGLLQALAAQLASGSVTRKRGCSAAIRNCCLAAEVRRERTRRGPVGKGCVCGGGGAGGRRQAAHSSCQRHHGSGLVSQDVAG